MQGKPNPPRWLRTILQRFANPNTLEEVEGDLLELFRLWETRRGRLHASFRYLITVLTLLRPFTRLKHTQQLSITLPAMLHSYFTINWRTLVRNKASSSVNLLGLTMGLTTGILIMLVVLDELAVDQFHVNKESVFLMMKHQKTNDGIITADATPGPLHDALVGEFPEVLHASRVMRGQQVSVGYEDKTSTVSGMYVDPEFFQFMTFPASVGDPIRTLTDKSGIVITESVANKMFGESDPIGRLVIINQHQAMTVGAVVRNIPDASSLQFDVALPFERYEDDNPWLSKWDDNRIQTLVHLAYGSDVTEFNARATRVLYNHASDSLESLFAYPYTDLSLHGSFSNGKPNGGKISMVKVIAGFGVFMVLIACINFMNVATAQSSHRAKEIGVRKVLGASRGLIIGQFLNESILMTTLSLMLSITLVLIIIPSFNTMMHTNIEFNITDPFIWLSTVMVALTTALVSGSYPAIFLSRFLPALVLKGKGTLSGRTTVRSALVTFQFIISVAVIIGTVILHAQFKHVSQRPIGYEQSNLIDIALDSVLTRKFGVIYEQVAAIPGINSVSSTADNVLYAHGWVSGIDWPGKKPGDNLSLAITNVGYNWTNTMGIDVVAGRDFSPEFGSDSKSCLLNESAVSKMGLTDPIGANVGGSTVIGVVRDFVFNNPSAAVSPMIINLTQDVNHLYIRVANSDRWRASVDDVGVLLRKVSPDYTLSFAFTSAQYQRQFNEYADVGFMVSVFGGMTFIISVLGLFGLAGFVADKRRREVSVRKIFGASSTQVLLSLAADFMKPVFMAIIIVLPLCIWLSGALLENIVYRVSLSWWMFVYPVVSILGVVSLVVMYHGWQTARQNPAKVLQQE